MKTIQIHGNTSGFTLMELLVAFALSAVLLIILASMADVGARWSSRLHTDFSTRRKGKVALDYLQEDVASIVKPSAGSSSVSIKSETVSGPAGVVFRSSWVTMATRAATSSYQGVVRTVSYRVVYTDPLTPNGQHPRLALFRSVQRPVSVDNSNSDTLNRFLITDDLHADYWDDVWDSYSREDSGWQLLDDFLIGNVVGFKASVEYLDQNGKLQTPSQNPNQIRLMKEGFSVDSASPPNTPVSINFHITVLSETGMIAMEDGIKSIDEAIKTDGFEVSRKIQLMCD